MELNPYLRLGTKLNRRIFATSIGIAFCLAYLTGTMAMASGLHHSTETIASAFDQGPRMIYTDEDLSLSFIDGGVLDELGQNFIAFTFATVNVSERTGNSIYQDVYVVSIYDPEDNLGFNMTNESVAGPVLIGTELVSIFENVAPETVPGTILDLQIDDRTTTSVNLITSYSGAIFAEDWLIVPRVKMDLIKPEEFAGNYSFLLLLGQYQSSVLPGGITPDNIRTTSSVVSFFEKGIYQVENDLWAIVLATGTIVVLLVYSIMSIETQYNAQTIEVLRRLGAKRRVVIGIFMFKSLMITMIGGIIGLAMGFVIANAVISGSYLFGITTIITPMADFNTIFMPLAVSFVAGIVGGLIPSIKASKMFARKRTEVSP